MQCKCFDPGPKSRLTCESRSLQGHRRSAEESKLGSQGAVPESAAAGFVAAAGVADPPLISEAARAPLQPHRFALRSLSVLPVFVPTSSRWSCYKRVTIKSCMH